MKNDKIFVLWETSMLGRDIYREILLKLEDEDLMEACCSNRYFHETVCNDGFFHTRLLQKYPDTLKIKPENMKYKAWFLTVGFWIRELRRDKNYGHGSVSTYETDSNKEKFLFASSKNNQYSLIRYSLSHPITDLPLRFCQYGESKIIHYIMDQISNIINNGDNDALNWAAKNGHLEIVKI